MRTNYSHNGIFGVSCIAFFLGVLCGPISGNCQQAPPNDAFTNRIEIVGTNVTVTGSSIGATGSTPFAAGLGIGGASVWWSWIAPVSGGFSIDTIGSSFDTTLAVFTGTFPNQLVAVIANDDVSQTDPRFASVTPVPEVNGASRVFFDAVAGTQYQIHVDGYNTGSFAPNAPCGEIVLHLKPAALPQIPLQLTDKWVLPGANVSFMVPVFGQSPLRFQWYKDGVAIPKATNMYNTAGTPRVTNAYYTISSAALTNAGVYNFVVSNANGLNVSSNCQLFVGPVFISKQPVDQIIAEGYPATLSIAVRSANSAEQTFQWYKNNESLPGETNASLNIGSAQATDAGIYKVMLSTEEGNFVSSNATLKIISPYTFTVLAGKARKYGTNDGMATDARFFNPRGIALDAGGTLYVTTSWGLRKITPEGVVTTIAGRLGVGSNDGQGSAAMFNAPEGIAVDSATNLYVCDSLNHTIRKIDVNGVVTTLAGMPGASGWGNGYGGDARFKEPSGIAIDRSGNLFVAERGNSRIRKIAPNGLVTTFAGNTDSYADAPGTKALFYGPNGIAIDAKGYMCVTDQQRGYIRKISPEGNVTTLASVGSDFNITYAYGGALDSEGNYYFTGTTTVKRVTPDGIVSILAGSPFSSGNADGAGQAARFSGHQGSGIAVDPRGNIYVADSGNYTIRKGVPFAVTTMPQSQTVLPGAPVTLSVGAIGGPFSYQWLHNGKSLPGETNTSLVIGPVTRSNTGAYSVIVDNGVGNSITFYSEVRALYQPVLQAADVRESGLVRLTFQDSDGGVPYDLGKIEVQYRTNLPTGIGTNWVPLSSKLYLSNNVVVLDDTNVVNEPCRFYRLLEF